MSHLDAQAEFSVAQTVTATGVSAQVMQLKGSGLAPNATTNIGAPALIYFVVSPAGEATGEGSLTVSLRSGPGENLVNDVVDHATSGKIDAAIVSAALAGNGPLFVLALPFDDYHDYLGAWYTVEGEISVPLNAYLTLEPRLYRVFSDGLLDPATGRP